MPLIRATSAFAVGLTISSFLSPALASEKTGELFVFSAASAAPVVSEAAARFQQERGIDILVSSGASGTLLSQVLAGAPCDLLVTADARHQQVLIAQQLASPSAAIAVASNSLTLAVWKDAATTPLDESQPERPNAAGGINSELMHQITQGRFAIADPALAPLGRYSAEVIRSAGIDITSDPPGAYLGSAAAVRKALHTRSVDAAILYSSDAAALPVDVARHPIPADMHSPIRYVAIPIIGARTNHRQAEAFAQFLQQNRSAWRRAGMARAVNETEQHDEPRIHAPTIGEACVAEEPDPQLSAQPALGKALMLTLQTSLIATLLNLAPGTLIGLWLARSRGPARIFIESLTIAPLVVPPVVTGFALLAALRAVAPDLLFTMPAATLAAMIVSLPLIVRSVRAAAEQTDARLPLVAATLGASRTRILFTVTLPLIMPGIVGGATLAWARAAGEFGATIVVAGNISGRTQTLPLAIWTAIQSPAEVSLLPMVVASIALSMAAVAVGEYVIRAKRPAPSPRINPSPA